MTATTVQNDGSTEMSSQSSQRVSRVGDIDLMYPAKYRSPLVKKFEAMLPDFFVRLKAQEHHLVAAGHDADGLTEYLRDYMHSWDQDDYTKADIRRPELVVTEDFHFTISSTFGQVWTNGPGFKLCFKGLYFIARELLFAPISDDETVAAPYFDFSQNGMVRISLPWVVVFSSRVSYFIPKLLRVGPLRRSHIWTGIDRYLVHRIDGEWKMSRVDTDFDLMQIVWQLLPLPTWKTVGMIKPKSATNPRPSV